jgi:hypothetical protein
MNLLVRQSPPVLSCLVLLGHSILPQLAIPKRRQPLFLPERERPNVTATLNNQQHCRSVRLNTDNICYRTCCLIDSSFTFSAITNFMKQKFSLTYSAFYSDYNGTIKPYLGQFKIHKFLFNIILPYTTRNRIFFSFHYTYFS